MRHCTRNLTATALASLLVCAVPVLAQTPGPAAKGFLWSNPALSPDVRADMVMQRMTLAQKIRLVHGAGLPGFTATDPAIVRSNGGSGFVPGMPNLGIPDLNLDDSSVGVAHTAAEGRYATALPSTLALASSWDPRLAHEYGSLIGSELADEGFNVSLAGGVDITREPRDGRTFEYEGEDPILAGNMVAGLIEGIQSHHVIGDVKHYAVNDQETGRAFANSVIGERALRETDLLAFQIAVQEAHPGMVMCSYNLINGVYACQNPHTLDQILKGDWGFKGFVISDWFATHSTVRATQAGLDMEMPDDRYFGGKLQQAIEDGRVPMARLNDMVHRILRTEFALGLVDHPVVRQVPNIFQGFKVAQQVEEQSAVLLKNTAALLPLDPARITSIAVIGSHAGVAVLSGGGSAQVDPPGGSAVPTHVAPGDFAAEIAASIWDPSSPLDAIRAQAPQTRVTYDPGTSAAAAAAVARAAQIAIVFVREHTHEGDDVEFLKLPGNQDAVVAAVAAANPHTIVVLETGGPVEMPWKDRVAAILEAWYPGIRGGQAIAALLFGEKNPSGKLAVTFPQSDAQLPHPTVPAPPGPKPGLADGMLYPRPPFDVQYTEGLKVGYKWFDAEHEQPLFPFGFGLSYTTFAYSELSVESHQGTLTVRFSVRNTGSRAGAEIAEAYLAFPPGSGEPPKRLIGWEKVPLEPGQVKTVTLDIQPLYVSIWNTRANRWRIFPGRYTVRVGPSSRDLPLSATLRLP